MADRHAACRSGLSTSRWIGSGAGPWRATSMPSRKKKSHAWIYLVWGVNIVVILGLLIAGAFYLTNQRALAANGAMETPHPGLTRTAPPTRFFLPTLTPNAFYTPPVFETSTPFVLTNGTNETIIGYSLAVRPIEVYSFGDG